MSLLTTHLQPDGFGYRRYLCLSNLLRSLGEVCWSGKCMMRSAVLRFDPVDALKLIRKTVTISSDLDENQPFVMKKY